MGEPELKPTAAPQHRWFQFSLRTLFAVLTLFGVLLGWQANVVHVRKSLLNSLVNDPHLSFDPRHTVFGSSGTILTFSAITRFNGGHGVPWFRRILGDEAVTSLGLPSDMAADEVRRFNKVFPEAMISQEPAGQNFTTNAPNASSR